MASCLCLISKQFKCVIHKFMSEMNHGYDQPSPPKVEQELTPETIEQIMEKVQDIDQDGIAYSSVYRQVFPEYGPKNLENIVGTLPHTLQDGLLGTEEAMAPEGKEKGEGRKQKWAENVRKKRNALVYFNILGRSSDDARHVLFPEEKRPSLRLNESMYMNGPTSLTFLFDSQRFQEVIPPHPSYDDGREWKNLKKTELRLNEFRHDHDMARLNDKGQPMPSAEFGFVLQGRVRPSDFKGIVFAIPRKFQPEDYLHLVKAIKQATDYSERERLEAELSLRNMGHGEKWLREESPWNLKTCAGEIAKTMLQSQDKPELLIPIYDSNGNLWWPKQMSYEEVKNFVAAREEKEIAR